MPPCIPPVKSIATTQNLNCNMLVEAFVVLGWQRTKNLGLSRDTKHYHLRCSGREVSSRFQSRLQYFQLKEQGTHFLCVVSNH